MGRQGRLVLGAELSRVAQHKLLGLTSHFGDQIRQLCHALRWAQCGLVPPTGAGDGPVQLTINYSQIFVCVCDGSP